MPKVAEFLTVDAPMADFCRRYRVSVGRMAELMGGIGRSTAHRMIHDQCAPEFADKLLKELRRTLPDYLLKEKQLDKSQVDAELALIFEKGEYEPMITQRIELTATVSVARVLSTMKARPRRQMSIATAMALGEMARAALRQHGVEDTRDVTITVCGYKLPRNTEPKSRREQPCHKM